MKKRFRPDDELTTAEAAQYLGILPSTLRWLRQSGRGPMYLDYGYRTKRYLPRHLDAWKRARRKEALRTRVIMTLSPNEEFENGNNQD